MWLRSTQGDQFIAAIPPCVCNEDYIATLAKELRGDEELLVVVPDSEEKKTKKGVGKVGELHWSGAVLLRS